MVYHRQQDSRLLSSRYYTGYCPVLALLLGVVLTGAAVYYTDCCTLAVIRYHHRCCLYTDRCVMLHTNSCVLLCVLRH